MRITQTSSRDWPQVGGVGEPAGAGDGSQVSRPLWGTFVSSHYSTDTRRSAVLIAASTGSKVRAACCTQPTNGGSW